MYTKGQVKPTWPFVYHPLADPQFPYRFTSGK